MPLRRLALLTLLSCAVSSAVASSALPSSISTAAAARTAASTAAAAALSAPPSADCDACLLVVGVAAEIGHANSSTLAQLLKSLDGICAAVAGNASVICDLIAELIVDDALPFLDVQLDTLAWPIPQGVCSLFLPVCYNPCCAADYAPEQVRLALTDAAGEMRVSWVTLTSGEGAAAGVAWGAAGGALSSSAPVQTVRNYTFGNWIGFISTATMTGLASGSAYDYQVGSAAAAGGLSRRFSFRTLAADAGSAATPVRIVQIGDMGYGPHSNTTIATVTAMVEAGQVDLIMHVGDVSYADGYMAHWDDFGRKVENISSSVPYMVGPGNHEIWGDFEAFRKRWSMPNYDTSPCGSPACAGAPCSGGLCQSESPNMYYAFDAGSVHISMTNTESPVDTPDMNATVRAFLLADLEAGAAARSWTIVGGHRPFYCSNGGEQCGSFASILRGQGEAILANRSSYSVDLVINAHEHGYQRSLPLRNGVIVSQTYVDAPAPVYVVNGAGGNRESQDLPGPAAWSKFESAEVGFALITAAGKSLTYSFLAANGTALDTFVMTKS